MQFYFQYNIIKMSLLENKLQNHIDYLNNEIFAINEILNHKVSEIETPNNELESLKLEKYLLLT